MDGRPQFINLSHISAFHQLRRLYLQRRNIVTENLNVRQLQGITTLPSKNSNKSSGGFLPTEERYSYLRQRELSRHGTARHGTARQTRINRQGHDGVGNFLDGTARHGTARQTRINRQENDGVGNDIPARHGTANPNQSNDVPGSGGGGESEYL